MKFLWLSISTIMFASVVFFFSSCTMEPLVMPEHDNPCDQSNSEWVGCISIKYPDDGDFLLTVWM